MSDPGKVTAGFARTRPVTKSGATPDSTVNDKYFKYLYLITSHTIPIRLYIMYKIILK